jgi:alpha-glucosidase
MDGNDDGLGDLIGLTARLPYLADLGVSAVWLTPFYRTNFFDFGYDVVNHFDVDPRFGSMSDFDRMLATAHDLGLRVILDFVPNHTSASHPWFTNSRSSRGSAKRDWYLWRDPGPDGEGPNNWTTQYKQSAWTWDEPTGQYYLHSFHPCQPDLNWANPEVREAMWSVLRFWMNRGTDGFRVDALVHLVKDPLYRDNPAAPGKSVDEWPAWPMTPAFTQDQSGLKPIVQEMCRVVREYPNRILIGENHLPIERLPSYCAAGMSHPVNSQLLDAAWDAAAIRRAVDRYEGMLPADCWPNWVLGSHDNPRIASRWGEAAARTAAMLQLTLRGTPIIYYGEELGLQNVPITFQQARDPLSCLVPGNPEGRDVQRTPMPWTTGEHAGFSTSTPWLPLSSRHGSQNVAAQDADPNSYLNLYRNLLRLRAAEPALRLGDYRPLYQDHQAFIFLRQDAENCLFVLINCDKKPWEIPSGLTSKSRLTAGELILSTHAERPLGHARVPVRLDSHEGVIIRQIP